jgi:hypothetical protein
MIGNESLRQGREMWAQCARRRGSLAAFGSVDAGARGLRFKENGLQNPGDADGTGKAGI